MPEVDIQGAIERSVATLEPDNDATVVETADPAVAASADPVPPATDPVAADPAKPADPPA